MAITDQKTWLYRATFAVAISLALPAFAHGQDVAAEAPSVGIRLANAAIPGLIQLSEGKSEGWCYLPGTALMASGLALQIASIGENADLGAWAFPAGLLAGDFGGSLFIYSQYAFLRDFSDANVDGAKAKRRGRESLASILAAPFDPRNMLSTDVLPVLGMGLAQFITDPAMPKSLASYWGRDSVSFAGLSMSPGAALAAETAYAMTVNLFVAASEELAFRGIFLEQLGLAASSLAFGAIHLGNLLVVDAGSFDAVWSVGMQAAFGVSMGFYLGAVTERSGYDIRKAVAYHYWNNVGNYILSFMSRGGGEVSNLSQGVKSASRSLVGPTISFTIPI